MIRLPIRAFYYEWIGTKDNHAGMAYFAKCLKKDLGLPFSIFRSSPKDRTEINLAKQYARFTLPWTNCLFLMEYLTPIGIANQENIALSLRKWGVKKPMIGLVHLPESLLLKYWKMEYIRAALEALDQIVVYGSSLAKFFEKIGFGHKVRQTLHYVDTGYYRPLQNKEDSRGKFKVIVIGSLLRDANLLKEIVLNCPDIIFQVCGGINDLKPVFEGYENVLLSGYISESELLLKIQQSDASVSVMEDTVGSNVIVGGLACGLPQIVSDVGSIRDYCSGENTIFCKNLNDFVGGLRLLSQNKNLCLQMGKSARKRAEQLALPSSIKWFQDFFKTVNEGKQ